MSFALGSSTPRFSTAEVKIASAALRKAAARRQGRLGVGHLLRAPVAAGGHMFGAAY